MDRKPGQLIHGGPVGIYMDKVSKGDLREDPA
jgi:hypothetical protein